MAINYTLICTVLVLEYSPIFIKDHQATLTWKIIFKRQGFHQPLLLLIIMKAYLFLLKYQLNLHFFVILIFLNELMILPQSNYFRLISFQVPKGIYFKILILEAEKAIFDKRY